MTQTADAENSPFLKLALLEAIQAVKDGMEEGATVPMETGDRRNPINERHRGGKPHPILGFKREQDNSGRVSEEEI
jgi:hypothetical protein